MIAREISASGLSGLACNAICGSQSLTVTAAGTTQATATALSSAFNVVTTCALGANGVQLPVNQPGDSIQVCNATSANCYVYPPTGGSFSGGTANIPFCMGPNASEEFTQISATNYTN